MIGMQFEGSLGPSVRCQMFLDAQRLSLLEQPKVASSRQFCACSWLIVFVEHAVNERSTSIFRFDLQRSTAGGWVSARCVSWQQRAASNFSGAGRLRGFANQASLSQHIPASSRSPDYPEAQEEPVMAQRLDDFAEEVSLGPCLLLKIDTEGHDLEVLQGARALLERGVVAAIVFEIAGQMNPDFFQLHKDAVHWMDPASRAALVSAKSQDELTEPTLHSMVRWLETLGYVTWLLSGLQVSF